ncbi:MAG TPA: maleylpyruvate isomerase family mycothiol-dependent enzyme [Microlunatus sp.]|nr:maleylpyruvate isomerase family mycothiol-dependent enzyme [Microlunatus sp.]
MDNSVGGVDELTLLAELQAAFEESIDAVDAEATVPWCGDWEVSDLVEHLSDIHHWAAAMARSTDVERWVGVADPRLRYATCAAELRTTLESLDPSAPARTLLEGGTVAFWHRRQLHETLVHLWDLRTAGGLDLVVGPVLWADTVDEVVTVMHPRQVRLGRAPAPTVRLVLAATDLDRTWSLSAAADAPAARAATLNGPAEALALLLWRRTGLDDPRLSVDGDEVALAAVLADHFVP